ncbi:MAG TPA: DUF2510 domain-containing protein [Acidimicrobiales bacterium]|jgi:hypothetical protein|nr:DUF2510 domain-containing protein [Acidimicrobiales bacterium]
MYYAHGSWIALVIFAGLFALRALSSQRRRGQYRGPAMPKSSLTRIEPGGPPVTPPSVPDPNHTGTAPGWFRDPFFKHDHRYWSGTEWTEHVNDNGAPAVDPPPSKSDSPQ